MEKTSTSDLLLKVGAFSMIEKLQTSRRIVCSSSGVGRRLQTGAGIGEPESNLVDKKIRAVVDWWTPAQCSGDGDTDTNFTFTVLTTLF